MVGFEPATSSSRTACFTVRYRIVPLGAKMGIYVISRKSEFRLFAGVSGRFVYTSMYTYAHENYSEVVSRGENLLLGWLLFL